MVVLDADGAVVVEQERIEEVLAAAQERVEREQREAREAPGGRALVRPRRPAAARREVVTEPLHDLARIGHVELLTPKPEESLRFFVEVLGMEEEAREGQSVYLRGWGDYLRYSLKLTEAPAGRARPHGAARVEPRGARAAGRRDRGERAAASGWIDGDVGHGPAYRFTDPDGHVFELYYEAERYEAPEHLRPSWRNQPQRYVGRGAAVKRLDHVNVLAADVRANRVFAQELLGYRLYERIELDDGTEAGAWLSLSIAAHELIYVADAYRANGRLHHLAFWVDTREECLRAADLFVDNGRLHRGRALEARDRAGLLPLRLRAGRQPDRGDDRRLLRLRPGLRADRRGRRGSAPAASSGACRRSRASTPTARRTSRATT